MEGEISSKVGRKVNNIKMRDVLLKIVLMLKENHISKNSNAISNNIIAQISFLSSTITHKSIFY